MNFIIWIVVGGLIGWVASMIMKTNEQQGMFLNIVVGMSVDAGWLADLAAAGRGHDQPERLQPARPPRLAGRRGYPAGDREPVRRGKVR